MNQAFSRTFVSAIFIVALAVCFGCKRDDAIPITGTVLLDGQSLDDGEIKLVPLKAGPTAGGKIRQGRFTIEAPGVMPGRYRVQIESWEATEQVNELDNEGQTQDYRQIVPARFNANSNLEIEVSRSESQFAFELSME